MKTSKTVLVGLLSITAGAMVGILLAPGKGAETRKKIVHKSSEFTEGLKDKFSQKGDELRQDAGDQLAKGKNKFEEAKKNVEYTAM